MCHSKGAFAMKRQDLVAPEWYNIAEEIEKYAQDATKML